MKLRNRAHLLTSFALALTLAVPAQLPAADGTAQWIDHLGFWPAGPASVNLALDVEYTALEVSPNAAGDDQFIEQMVQLPVENGVDGHASRYRRLRRPVLLRLSPGLAPRGHVARHPAWRRHRVGGRGALERGLRRLSLPALGWLWRGLAALAGLCLFPPPSGGLWLATNVAGLVMGGILITLEWNRAHAGLPRVRPV